MIQKITPFLWFEDKCEEAINFYVDTFNGNANKKSESKVISIKRYEEGMEVPGVEEMMGKVLTVIFELEGQRYMALDGGPFFKFTPAISLYVECADQKEVDYFWEKMSAVPQAEQCGWIQDRFGMSWQIIPKQLGELLEKDKSNKVLNAMLKMKKIDIKTLQEAYDQ